MQPRLIRPVLAISLALALSGCGDADAGPAAGTPTATASCDEVEFPPLQFGSHLLGTAEPPIAYSSTPPTSGWHTSGAPASGVQSTALTEPQQVSTLEAGGIVVTYNGLEEQDFAALRDVIERDYADSAALTEYDELDPGQVVLTSWGALQRCRGVDLDAVATYAAAYGNPVSQHQP